MRNVISAWVGCAFFLGLTPSLLYADPCGMVPPPPPPYIQKSTVIERVGAQKTYVFYRNGVESIVLRPGFKGKVGNFGMLIPFPGVPAIRKVPNEIFSHLANAVNPPEVVVRVSRFRFRPSMAPMAAGARRSRANKDSASRRLSIHAVRVLRQEAVGMYQVAVLRAGSPKALKRWMKKHGYIYPKGMEPVTREYIRAGWCFVAVKARVAGKKGISPRPGMRKVSTAFPKGATFTGKVQAMGFRFRTRKLVVPMRLSAFNKGRLHNIVYLLTYGARKIDRIPQKFVMRQVSGKEIYRNVMKPLPLRIYGGTHRQIQQWRWRQIKPLRNPEPHNGHARDLIASDLLSSRTGKLALKYEEDKKVLLRIEERLGLRGKHIDKLNRDVLKKQRDKILGRAIEGLKRMTLTIVDGDFPRQIIAKHNLTFGRYRMPKRCNKTGFYNARTLQKRACNTTPMRFSGRLYRKRGPKLAQRRRPQPRRDLRRRRRKRLKSRTLYRLIRRLSNAKRANRTVARLVRAGTQAVPYLLGEAIEGSKWERRGWSFVALSSIGGAKVKRSMRGIYRNGRQHALIRTFAGATWIQLSKDAKDLVDVGAYANQLRALQRPLKRKLLLLARRQRGDTTENIIALAASSGLFRQWLQKPLRQQPPKKLIRVMLFGKTLAIRRMAASYAGIATIRGAPEAVRHMTRLLAFKPNASDVPWVGGPLYLASLPMRTLPRFNDWGYRNRIRALSYQRNWQVVFRELDKLKSQIQKARKTWQESVKRKQRNNVLHRTITRKLVTHLLTWAVWAEQRNKSAELNKIFNNLRNGRLAQQAGYTVHPLFWRDLQAWLDQWGKVVGYAEVKKIVRKAGAHRTPKYQLKAIRNYRTHFFKRKAKAFGPQYLGCYIDKPARDLRRYVGGYASPQRCMNICRRYGYKYAGLQLGYQCFCGNTYGKYGKAPEYTCSRPCNYNRQRFCGGSWRNSIYKTR